MKVNILIISFCTELLWILYYIFVIFPFYLFVFIRKPPGLSLVNYIHFVIVKYANDNNFFPMNEMEDKNEIEKNQNKTKINNLTTGNGIT